MPAYHVSALDPDSFTASAQVQLERFLDDHRAGMHDSLDDLTDTEGRRSLVPSATTLLGLVKHATFIERVWFDEAISCRSRTRIGIPESPDESFLLTDVDTVSTVRADYLAACADSREAARPLDLDDLVHGNRRGPLPLRWVYFHMLSELAQHCGHADILREQILAAREGQSP